MAELIARGLECAADLNDTPAELTMRSSVGKRWWRCVHSGHVWAAACNSIATGSGCPFPCCCKPLQQLCGCAAVCLPASCGSPAYVTELSARGVEYAADVNDVLATLISRRSSSKRWWRCLRRGHLWETRCYDVASGTGCPSCKR